MPRREASRPAAGPRAEHGRDPACARLDSGWPLQAPSGPLCSVPWSLSNAASMSPSCDSLFPDRGIGRARSLQKDLVRLRLSDFLRDSQRQHSRITAAGPSVTDVWIVSTPQRKTQDRAHDGRAGDGNKQDAHQLHLPDGARAPLKVRPLHFIY